MIRSKTRFQNSRAYRRKLAAAVKRGAAQIAAEVDAGLLMELAALGIYRKGPVELAKPRVKPITVTFGAAVNVYPRW
jgi:hypothetical protein